LYKVLLHTGILPIYRVCVTLITLLGQLLNVLFVHGVYIMYALLCFLSYTTAILGSYRVAVTVGSCCRFLFRVGVVKKKMFKTVVHCVHNAHCVQTLHIAANRCCLFTYPYVQSSAGLLITYCISFASLELLLTVALHMGVISDPTVSNATISAFLNNTVLNGFTTL